MGNTSRRVFVMAAKEKVLSFLNSPAATGLFLAASSSRDKTNCGQLASMLFAALVKASHRTAQGSFVLGSHLVPLQRAVREAVDIWPLST